MTKTQQKIEKAVETYNHKDETRCPTVKTMVEFVKTNFPQYTVVTSPGKWRVRITDKNNKHVHSVATWSRNIEFAWWIDQQIKKVEVEN